MGIHDINIKRGILERRLQMKIVRVLLIAILISLVGYPAYSQEPLVLYDNFQGESIDPNKWRPKNVADEILDVKRFIKGNRLHLMERSLGGTEGDRISGAVRLAFQNPGVTAIQAELKVKNIEVVGCDFTSETSSVRAGRLSGFFFNTVGEGIGAENDVLAAIEIRRLSNSDDPDGMLRVRGRVYFCKDEPCWDVDVLGAVDFGTIMVGQWIKLLIQWDRNNHQFIFQRDNGLEEIRPYDYSRYPDDLSPNIPDKRIGISVGVPTCPEGEPRPVGYAEVEIKDVFVNESALLE
jgi:hypothetical protein